MKKDRKIFETPLLFSQEEMALLLGITRSSWSMYVSGLRSIPTEATLKLAKLLESAAQLPLATPELSHRTVQEGKKKKMLQEELAKNKWETEVVERKLAKMQKQFQEAENTLQFISVHENLGDFNEQEVCILQNVKNRALTQVEKNGLHLQAQYQRHLRALKSYQKQLEKEIK
ncbi:MAG: hypothetical protein CMP76_14245 [Flavobacterium sp.]|uniref:helix-turn-helix domain-containing protein n=1 Tax=Flavobacterium sp. TaxID=239 RepID=UPI000C4CD4FF|nr:helix-turn-helix transcriptional regulator [Flavobacterium sp.]MBF04443.1 hypothetical protein [Flavobacterium sp.]